MPDGVLLLADHYAPRTGPKRPTLLLRSPYGRRGLFGGMMALPYAERGYQVLVQSCRGTAGSGGEFVYARVVHELKSEGVKPQGEQVMPAEWKHGEYHLENPHPLWYTPERRMDM